MTLSEAEGIFPTIASSGAKIIIQYHQLPVEGQHCHSPQAWIAAMRTPIHKGKLQFVLNLSLSQLPAHNSE